MMAWKHTVEQMRSPGRYIICIIARCTAPAVKPAVLIDELRFRLGKAHFPWHNVQQIFAPASSALPYFGDEHFQKIVAGYHAPENPAGLRSLVEVTYNLDSF